MTDETQAVLDRVRVFASVMGGPIGLFTDDAERVDSMGRVWLEPVDLHVLLATVDALREDARRMRDWLERTANGISVEVDAFTGTTNPDVDAVAAARVGGQS